MHINKGQIVGCLARLTLNVDMVELHLKVHQLRTLATTTVTTINVTELKIVLHWSINSHSSFKLTCCH